MITVEPGKADKTSIKRINEKNFSHILQKKRAQLSHPFSYSIQSNSARKKTVQRVDDDGDDDDQDK